MEFVVENFHLLSESPTHIEKLRQLVLQMAVSGKLVPQDPLDAPAEGILNRIREKKEHLIKQGKLKKKSLTPKIELGVPPFDLPKNWIWTSLQEIGEINPRNEFDDEKEASFIPMTLISESFGEKPGYEIKKWGEIKKAYTHLAEDDVAIAKITPCFENSKAGIMRGLKNGVGGGTTELHVFRRIDEKILPEYVYLYLKSPLILENGKNFMTGSAGQKRIPSDFFAFNHFPLPPLPEQHRIVQKVTHLFRQIDALADGAEQAERVRQRLRAALLFRLEQAPGRAAAGQVWGPLDHQFALAIRRVEDVQALRQTILQLAVKGLLVRQDSKDEPASVLLERIRKEKARLVKEGKIRKQPALPPVKAEEAPFEVPEGWVWCRLGELGYFTGGGTPSKNNPEYWNGNILWVTPKDMKVSLIEDSEMKITPVGVENSSAKLIPKNSVLVVARSGILKRLLPVGINMMECTVNQDIKVIVPFLEGFAKYIQLMLKGYESYILGNLVKGGTTVQSLKYEQFQTHPFPLPPLAEQRRIVERVERLLGWCERLEAGIRELEEKGEKVVRASLMK